MATMPEKNYGLLVAGAVLFFLVGTVLTALFPYRELGSVPPSPGAKPYSGLEAKGRAIYVREACVYCHSQQVRPVKGDLERYGAPSEMGEYVYDQPPLLGTRRIGPDLFRVGGKYSDAWHRQHLRDPQKMVPGSIMPKFTWLTEDETTALIAYLQSLGRGLGPRSAMAALPGGGLLEVGQAAYASNCAACHGATGVPTLPGAANFTTGQWKYGGSLDELIGTIEAGRSGGLMPAWKGKLSPDQIKAVALHVISLGPGGKGRVEELLEHGGKEERR